MPAILMSRPQLPALTSVRFLAAFAVLLYHLAAVKLFVWGNFLTGAGFTGVSFFFVLSGFILVYSHTGQPLSAKRFWRSRFARIYPAFSLSLLISLPFLLSLKSQPMFPWAAKHVGVISVSEILMIKAWLPLGALVWNPVSWSLSVEAFFYLLFPILLPRVARVSTLSLLCIVGGCFAIDIAMASTYLALTPDGPLVNGGDSPFGAFWKDMLKFNPAVHLPEFVIGMCTGLVFLRRQPGEARSEEIQIGIWGLACIAVLIFARPNLPYLVVHTGLLAPAFAATIYYIGLQPRWTRPLCSRFAVLLGNASYSLYLLHFVTIFYFFFIFGRKPFNWIYGPIYLIGVVALSVLVFKFVEEPARRRLAPKRRELLKAPESAYAAATANM